MSEELQYELPGLERKAHECESTRPEGPGDATKPDELATTASVYSKLMASAAKLKATFAAGDREGERIAAAIRAAAGAYQKIEEQKAAELSRQMNGSDAPPPAPRQWSLTCPVSLVRWPSHPWSTHLLRPRGRNGLGSSREDHP